MKISENIASATVKSGSVAVFSMGQAGFVFKLPEPPLLSTFIFPTAANAISVLSA